MTFVILYAEYLALLMSTQAAFPNGPVEPNWGPFGNAAWVCVLVECYFSLIRGGYRVPGNC